MGRPALPGQLIIGSRKSALARYQTFAVADAIRARHSALQLHFRFKESIGDKDLTTPLWQMGDRGVFTRDLTEDLIQGHIDLAVHSYKDLDMQSHPDTEICSVLPRADRRDVLLIKKSALQNPPIESLLIYTSSPRRMYNLQRILPRLLPKRLRTARLTFEPMRGNIQTRLRKFMQADGHGFVLAKAALDRLLAPLFPESSNHPEAMSSYSEFRSLRAEIRAILRENEFMCLPLTENPCAPAQGALAVEFRKTDEGIRALVEWIQNATVEHSVQTERSVLAQYGGGCHQKIGVVHFAVGHDRQALVARGMSDAGEVIERTEIQLHADAQSKDGEADASEIRSMESGAPVERKTAPAKSFADDAEAGLLENDSAGALAATGRFAGLVAADLDVWVKLAEQDFWIHAGNELIIDEKRSARPVRVRAPDMDCLLGANVTLIHATSGHTVMTGEGL